VKGYPDVESLPWGNAGVTEPQPDRWLDLGLKLDLGVVQAMFKDQSSFTQHEIGIYGVKLKPGQEGFYDKTWRTYALSTNRQLADNITLSAIASRFEFHSWENFAIQPAYPGALDTDPAFIREGQRSLQGNARDPRATHSAELRVSHFSGYPEGGWKNQLLAGILGLDMGSPANYATLLAPDDQPSRQVLDFKKSHRRSISLFGIDEWSPFPWVVLAAGARYRVEAPIPKAPTASDPDGSPGSWQQGINLQGAAVIAGDTTGGKLVYSEGYRVVDGNSLLSTSGVKGNPDLRAERSRELAVQLHAELLPGVTGSVGGNLTRLQDLINFTIITDDPRFSREPQNSGRTDIASGYAELRWESEVVDLVARYGISGLRESKPVRGGIPYAPHNLFGAVIVRPARDISLFARSSAVSRRKVEELIPGGSEFTYLPWAVRLTLGGTFSNVISRFDLDLRIDNPFNFSRMMPHDLTGERTWVEERNGTEVFATLRYTH
jgi:hypothetical protein